VIPWTSIPDVHFQNFIVQAVQDVDDAAALYPADPANTVLVWPMASRSLTNMQQREVIRENTEFVNIPDAIARRLRNLNAGNNNLERTIRPHVTRFVVNDADNTGRLQVLVNERIINTPNYTLVVIPLPRTPSPFLCVLAGTYDIHPGARHTAILTQVIRAAVIASPAIGGLVDTYDDGIPAALGANGYNRPTTIAALAGTIRVRHSGPVGNKGTEWAVFWDPPTRSNKGEQHFFNAFRRITMELVDIGQTINELPAPAVTCATCHFHDHTTPFCPFTNIPGWIQPVTTSANDGNNQGGPGGRGGFANRARGGGRGRGQGGRGRGM
jgi:hypothetical protein